MTVTPQPPPPPAPGAVPPPKKSGCWKWALIGCGALIIIGAIGVVGLVVGVFGVIKSTDVYRGALTTAQRDPRVIAALGTPIESGWWVSGNVTTKNRQGEADIEFPISGPKGKGHLRAVATRDTSAWHYTELTVTLADAPANTPPIDLLKP